MYPNHKDGDVDREDAEHEDEDGMGVVIEIIMDPRTLFQSENLCMPVCTRSWIRDAYHCFSSQPQRPRAGC